MSLETISLNAELYHYLLKHSLHEPKVLRNLRTKTEELSQANMQISPDEGHRGVTFLKSLIPKHEEGIIIAHRKQRLITDLPDK